VSLLDIVHFGLPSQTVRGTVFGLIERERLLQIQFSLAPIYEPGDTPF